MSHGTRAAVAGVGALVLGGVALVVMLWRPTAAPPRLPTAAEIFRDRSLAWARGSAVTATGAIGPYVDTTAAGVEYGPASALLGATLGLANPVGDTLGGPMPVDEFQRLQDEALAAEATRAVEAQAALTAYSEGGGFRHWGRSMGGWR